MGNNYYLYIGEESYHLGKSSGGWKFLLNIIEILKAIIEHLDIEELDIVKEVYEIVCISAFLKYKDNELLLWNDANIDTIKHKWILDYTDILKCYTQNREFIYLQIQISIITKKELFKWLRQLSNIDGAKIADENDKESSIDSFIYFIEDKSGLDMISYYSDKKYSHINMMPLSIEYKIGNLRCSSHADFC